MMSSCNPINGVESAESVDLLEGILREEWGVKGVVMTDWGNNSLHSAEIAAGNDVKMPKGNPKELLAAMRSGQLDRAAVRRSAGRIVETMLKFRVMRKEADSFSSSPSPRNNLRAICSRREPAGQRICRSGGPGLSRKRKRGVWVTCRRLRGSCR